MAMEMTANGKGLHKHAIPIIMVVVGLTALTVTGITYVNRTEKLALKGLTVRVLHIRPNTNGLAKVTLDSGSGQPATAGAQLGSGTAQTGRAAQLSLKLGAR